MKIELSNLGKRYNREWIFRNINLILSEGNQYAIIGANGSGKSTLIQIIAGAVTHNEGSIGVYNKMNQLINPGRCYRYIALAAPYLELVEEMTANEMIDFHRTLKPVTDSPKNILATVLLQDAGNKQIRYFSSGMKQRLKLALAFFSDTPILLLDEPTANLDTQGINTYQQLIENHTNNKLVIISSNEPAEYRHANKIIKIEDYKN